MRIRSFAQFFYMYSLDHLQITVVGLGYVGLPLAVEFGKKYPTVGVDIQTSRIQELLKGHDRTRELTAEELQAAAQLSYTTDLATQQNPDCPVVYIVTVPTPIDAYKKPDLSPLLGASKAVGRVLKKGDIVIYESTVYPGCTEEDCVPVLEKESGLVFNQDFFCGYSPERINPGDKQNTLTKILKITSGSTPEIADFVDTLYSSIITAGTYKAPSMKVAEAAKIIENAQRDINIAFVNELAKIFEKLNIDTAEVLEAAGTKWNFLKFKPGLVGGHCIGVDPYYLAQKAQGVGYHPEIILAGRRLNDGMSEHVAHEVIKWMIKKDIAVKGAHVLVMGITFKENCPDVRNTQVIGILNTLKEYGVTITVWDPWANPDEVEEEYGWTSVQDLPNQAKYDGVVMAVAHHNFDQVDLSSLVKPKAVIYDVKGVLPKELVDARL